MTEPGAKPRWRRLGKYLLWGLAIILVALGGLAWYATTDSFQAMVRRRLVAELERITGGRAELGGFHTTPFRFRADVRDVTIHGLEAPNEVPYAHVDRLIAQVKIISVFGADFGFDQLVLEHPVIHIIVYPDGRTNQPRPRVTSSEKNPVTQLFALSISRLEVRRGKLLVNDQEIPLDFSANDVSGDMAYSLLHSRYTGNLLLGKVDTTFKDWRPVAWTAEAHFTLQANDLAIQSLKATSGRSHLQASGHLKDFLAPKLDGTYDISMDLGELGAVAHIREMHGGVMTAGGQGSWSLQDFAAHGRWAINDLDWRSAQISLSNASLNAQFSVDPRELNFTQFQSRLMGGTVSGDARVSNWQALPSAGQTARTRHDELKGTLQLRAKDLSVAALASALSTRSLPMNKFNLAGTGSGTVAAQWREAFRNLEADVAFDVAPPARPAAGQVPLTAHAQGAYRGAPGELQVSDFSASTRATQIRASGTLSRSASLRFSITTVDLGEWQPVLAALGSEERIPIRIHGRASFNGAATGKLSDVTIAGGLQIQDFDWLMRDTEHTPERQVHWDLLATDVELSQHTFAARNGRLRHGEAAIRFDLNAGLQTGRLTAQSPFNARVTVRNADIGEVMALVGYNYPVSGTANLRLQASGTRAEPHGDGQVLLTKATVYGEPVEHFSSDLRFAGSEVELSNIQLTHYEARVSGSGTYDWSRQAFSFKLTGSDFDLVRIPMLQASRMKIEGKLDFTASGSGTVEAPVINATAHLRELTLDHERSGDFQFDAVTQGAELRLTGHSQFEHADLSIDGNIHLRGDWPSSVNLHFHHLDIDPLLRASMQGQLTGHSSVAGDLQLRGPLLLPRQLDMTGNLTELSAGVQSINVHNDGPVRFSVSNQLLTIEQFRLLGEGTDLSATGSMQLTGDRELDLTARGNLNLQLVETLNPDFTSSGVVTLDVTVLGSVHHPVMQGRLQVSKGSLAYIDLPSALSDINGVLVFNQDRLQIDSLTARVGGGQVKFGGYVTSYNRQINFDLTLQGQDVRLRYPPGVSSTTTADLRWVGSSTASTLSGGMTVTKLGITPGFDFGGYLERAAQASSLPQTNPLLNRIKLDVRIVTTPELQMQTAVARLSGDADLRLRGSAARPVLLGRADILEGEVYINGTKYRLERGDVTFTNPVTTTPVLDLQASTRVRDYDITLNLNGQVDKLNITYRSEPPLPTADIIALLALGRTQEEAALQGGSQSGFSQEASSAILAEALNATVTNRVQRLFGVSRIKIDPEGASTETSPVHGPQVTIEQQVANNLTVTYSTNVSQASQQIIQVEYNITRDVSVVGIRDQNGVVSFDVRIRRRRK